MTFQKSISIFALALLAGCTTISKSSMKSTKTEEVDAPAFGRILVKINGENQSENCKLHIKTSKGTIKYALDHTGEVFFKGENGAIGLQKIECNNGWDNDVYWFLDKIPAFMVNDSKKVTYFGRIEIDWQLSRKFNPEALIPILGTSPTFRASSVWI